jgi:hypothetical protein
MTVNNNEVNISCLLKQKGEPELLTQQWYSVGRVEGAGGKFHALPSVFILSLV